MSPEMKDQVAGGEAEGQSKEPALSMDEQIDKGWEQVELLTEQENAAKAKAKEGQPKGGETKKETDGSLQKPYRVLKVGGKEIPVKSEEELIELAQKGADYTKKTQTLADERREAEAKIKTETDRVTEAMEKAAELAERMMKSGVLPRKFDADKGNEPSAGREVGDQGLPGDLAKVYEEFQLDPANAYPHEKKYIEELAKMRNKVKSLEDERRIEREERAEKIVSETIAKERESYPFEEVKDDQGNDVTREKLKAIVATKRAIAGVEKPTMETVLEWVKESVRELHASQKGNGQVTIPQNMEAEEFEAKFPDFAKKYKEAVLEKARVEKGKLPPSLTPGRREVDPSKRPAAKAAREGKSSDDWIEEGFKDPDVLKAINGG